MSWLYKLIKTYDNSIETGQCSKDNNILLPICHTTNNAQIEIIINANGEFLDANVIAKNDCVTVIPCTEKSGGRTGQTPTCHPFCDKLQYIASDFTEYGGEVTSGYKKNPKEPHHLYLKLLNEWCSSEFTNRKVEAVYKYVSKGSPIKDLIKKGVLFFDEEKKQLLKKWDGPQNEKPKIFEVMQNNSPEDAFVRWIVEGINEKSFCWKDSEIWESWKNFYLSTQQLKGFCHISGQTTPLAIQHPAKIRNAADKAKLISSNDKDGFTFRGRFTDAEGFQACSIGYIASQKAHNALRWLIARQGFRTSSQAIVAWSVEVKEVPDLMLNTLEALFSEDQIKENIIEKYNLHFDAGEAFATRFNSMLSGYRKNLSDADEIIVMALDSATTGRMSISYYRELQASEFLNRIESWHKECCWFQNFGEKRKFVGAPSPKDIVSIAFYHQSDRVKESMLSPLLRCIIDGIPIPLYIVNNCVSRASNREGIESWEWEKALGIACAVYRKHKIKEKEYSMVLENEYYARDYLYGRLLAIAEYIEHMALYLANEKRETNAGKLLQQFANKPFTTWTVLEKALAPYKARLRTSRFHLLNKMEEEIDLIFSLFQKDDFISDARLTGEFLLGYHCQRHILRNRKAQQDEEHNLEIINNNN